MTRRLGESLYLYTFIVTFRIDTLTTTKPDYDQRLIDLGNAIAYAASGAVWKDPTSCFVFRSSKTMGEIAVIVARALHHGKDVALVVCIDGPEKPKLIGASDNEDVLMAVLPQTTKV